MNKETLESLGQALVAVANGETIQLRNRSTSDWRDYTLASFLDGIDLSFHGDEEFRLKPEPTVVPFTAKDAEILVGSIVRPKNSNTSAAMIISVCEDGVLLGGNIALFFNELLNKYVFADGSPCGTEVK